MVGGLGQAVEVQGQVGRWASTHTERSGWSQERVLEVKATGLGGGCESVAPAAGVIVWLSVPRSRKLSVILFLCC